MNIKVIRATETWQQAGAYYVRIQGMAKQHNITLRREFDEHDTPDTKYIVLIDDDFPVATCRLYGIDAKMAVIGRVVVLPEYRGKGLGKQVMGEAEKWLAELGYTNVVIESRDVAVGFYEKLGYEVTGESVVHGDTFDCVRMEKGIGLMQFNPLFYDEKTMEDKGKIQLDVEYNYLIGSSNKITYDYDYVNRPDPDTNGCKKLYDDFISLFFRDCDAINWEQQYFNRGTLWKNNRAWEKYEKLSNCNPMNRTNSKQPPFYTIKYNDYLLSTDYIGPSIYWAENSGLSRKEIVEILNVGRTIGGHIAWPRGGHRLKTINWMRGGKKTFYDRIDWTLYLLKLYFDKDKEKDDVIQFLQKEHTEDEYNRCLLVLEAIENYRKWYMSFDSFKSFCERFRLKGSFVDENYNIIWFASASPILPEDYRVFAENNIEAIRKRNENIENALYGYMCDK